MTKLTIDINGTCNIDCEFCYQDLDNSKLNLEQIEEIIGENPDASVVNIGGGEPLLHKDIISIIKSVYDGRKKAHISTNATILPKGILDLDEEVRKNTSMQVSINAATPEIYKEVTGKDLFYKVLENTELLKPKYHTVLSAVIYKKNFHESEKIIELGQELGLPVKIGLVIPSGKGRNVELITKEEANWLRGVVLLKGIKAPGSVYGHLIHENTCPLINLSYGLGENKGYKCLESKIYHDPRGQKKSCEFIQEVNSW